MKLFYDEVTSKRKNKRMRLQVDNEFQQVKIKDLNDEKNVEMFTSSVRGGKAFAVDPKCKLNISSFLTLSHLLDCLICTRNSVSTVLLL